jgi:hypothetical protein
LENIMKMTDETRLARKRARNRNYRAANIEACREAARKWVAANPEAHRKWARQNPEKARESRRTWAKTHPTAIRTKKARYRASKLNACPPWADHAALAHLEAARWIFASLMQVDESEVHLDHIVPLKASSYIDGKLTQIASGLHAAENLTFKLARANTSKGPRFDEAELDYPPTYEQVTYITHHHGTGAGLARISLGSASMSVR